MSLVYSKEKYEAHEVFLNPPKPRSISLTKYCFTICEIDKDRSHIQKPEKLSNEDYMRALKLHNNPRSKSVSKIKIEETEQEYSNDFESEAAPKYSLAELKLMKKQLQDKKKKIEKKNKLKAEMIKQKEAQDKVIIDEEAKDNFFKWVEEKRKQKAEEKRKRAQVTAIKSKKQEEEYQMKIDKKFREMEERQQRISKLKHDDFANQRVFRKNEDFPTILAYSTSRKIKSQKF